MDATAPTMEVAAVGDIACDPLNPAFVDGDGTAKNCRQGATAGIVAVGPAGDGSSSYEAVLPLGDEQYECGTLANFAASYDTSWGRFNPIAWPVPGNHEYQATSLYGSGCSPDGSGYFSYFGAVAAGVAGKGYYSYDLGSWHVIAINSNCAKVGGCAAGSPQETWLRADLTAHGSASCTLAYWHHAPWASAPSSTGVTNMRRIWSDLAGAGADLVLVGHFHAYERFADMNANGQPVPDGTGLREIIVGTGGEKLMSGFRSPPLVASQARNHTTYGVLSLALAPGGYSWRFVGVPGSTFADSGSDVCH
jgi:hypothetical protein